MKYSVAILFFLSFHCSMALNPSWIKKDKQIISQLVQIDQDSIHSLENYFNPSKRSRMMTKLGFGWEIWSASKTGGYISIRGDFYYFKDSLVSFKIIGSLPDKNLLKKKYTSWYKNFFILHTDGRFLPHTHNFRALMRPLANIEDSLEDLKLRSPFHNLMIPTQDLCYFWRGGYSNEMPYNRKLFLENSDLLTFNELKYMTYSINPITRFLAIEEIIRKKYINRKCSEADLEWFDRCFREIPNVKTLSGCLGSYENSEKLVNVFSQMKYP